MIRALRRRHLVVVGVFAPIVLGLFGAGIAMRLPRASAAALPGETEQVISPQAGAEWSGLGSEEDYRMRNVTLDGALGIEIVSDLAKHPDVLAYWISTDEDPEGLPTSAVLLGALPSPGRRAFSLPKGADLPGRVILFSLGHGEVVASATVSEEGS